VAIMQRPCYARPMKRFLEWIRLKHKLDASERRPPFISEGDLWWCSIGKNVGVETYGKDRRFTRPVIVLKKFGHASFLGIPTTTTERKGSWYVSFTHHGIPETAMLNQVRILSSKRLDRKIGTLDDRDVKNVKEAFMRLF
jgi:mRNA interferase MazF